MGGTGKVVQVDYYGYEHSQMQHDFDQTKARFEQKRAPGVTWIFHGTGTEENLTAIMTGGFKVGGVGGHTIAAGAAYGQGKTRAVPGASTS